MSLWLLQGIGFTVPIGDYGLVMGQRNAASPSDAADLNPPPSSFVPPLPHPPPSSFVPPPPHPPPASFVPPPPHPPPSSFVPPPPHPPHFSIVPPPPQPPPDAPRYSAAAFPSLSHLSAQCLAAVPSALSRTAACLAPLPVRAQLLGAFSRHKSLSDEILPPLLRGVTELDLSDCVHVTCAGLAAIGAAGGALRSLRLDGLSLSDEALAAIGAGCARLAALSLRRCRRVTDGCVAAVASRGALTALDLSFCRQLGDEAALAALRHCPLASLLVDGTRVSDALLRHTPPLGRLSVLSLHGCRAPSEAALRALLRLSPRLECLRIGGTSAADATVEAIAECLPRLRLLSLEGCAAISDRALPLLLLGCPSLTALDVSRCTLVHALRFHHSSHSLCELQLSHCVGLAPATLVEIAENCEALTTLWLEGCAVLNDSLVFQLCQGCAALERISFSYCDAITERAIFYIAMLRRIAQLCVGGCAQLYDEQVITAVSVCNTLRALMLPSLRQLWQ
ncbi:hypothetical protein AB1Y20_012900 [Prymnesium parvum]|uniref:F-box/LRR-repeat protein 15-like leucin rich repeat domain-containing protein n=1 Tax=Prymnesium parvum TaxID=97485 RepID=A0AB34ILV4_PRYPA